MKLRKRILLLLGVIQIILGFNFSISHPRATSIIEKAEKEIMKEFEATIGEYALSLRPEEKEVRIDLFQHRLEPLVYTANSIRETKSKAADTLFFSGILVFVAALTIPNKTK